MKLKRCKDCKWYKVTTENCPYIGQSCKGYVRKRWKFWR